MHSTRQNIGDDKTVVYKNPDGTMTAHVYGDRVQYRKADGTFAPIDDTLAATRSGRLRATADSLDVEFAGFANDPDLMSVVSDPSHVVNFALAGAGQSAAQVEGATATYANVMTDADLQIKAVPSGAKETLVLKSASAPTTWVFPYTATGLTPQNDPSTGDIQFTDSTGKVVVRVPHGSMADSKVDPLSNQPTTSNGVSYTLVNYQGSPALQVALDATWLHDAARVFPVYVDPTSTLTVSSSTYTENAGNTGVNSGSTLLSVGSYDGGVHQATSFLAFTGLQSTFSNDWIRGSWLNLYDTWDSSCTPEPVYVHPVTGSWNVDTLSTTNNGYPGAPVGTGVLGSKSFAASPHCTKTQGTGNWVTIGLDAPTLDNYTHGASFWGLALTAPTANTSATWKQFAALNGGSANPPYLAIDYSTYGVKWTGTASWVTPPTSTSAGTVAIPVENWGTTAWTSTNGYSLHFTQYNTATNAIIGSGSTGIPAGTTVNPRSGITLNLSVPAQPNGTNIKIVFDMYGPGSPAAFSGWLAPTLAFIYQGADIAPQIKQEYPVPNVTEGSLTPTLITVGFSPNNPPSPLKYDFWVCQASVPWSGTPSNSCASSGWLNTGVNAWTIPSGTLSFNQSYYWVSQVSDGTAPSAVSLPSKFDTVVGQPVLTSHLAQNNNPHGYDPESGNYTTAAVDATVPGAGMPLQIQRTYNTLDFRTDEAFGRGWATLLDAQAILGGDGSVTVTYPSGQQIRYGKNPDGTYTSPQGGFATLSLVAQTGTGQSGPFGSVTLTDKNGTRYVFAYPLPAPQHWVYYQPTCSGGFNCTGSCNIGALSCHGYLAPNPDFNVIGYTLTSITDAVGNSVQIGSQPYTAPSTGLARYLPDSIINKTSGRALHLTWQPDASGQQRIASVATDPVVAGTPTTALTWNYTYNTDGSLASVCPPGTTTACTTYGYVPNSHLRPAMLDADPAAYWPLGEPAGSTTASDAVVANEGVNNAVNSNVTFGAAGSLPSSTSASFDGSTSYVQLPNGQIQGSSFLSVELWFKTSATGAAQMLFATGHDPANAANPGSGAMPVLYVGTDGVLHGHFWNGTTVDMTSGCQYTDTSGNCQAWVTVNDGNWHQVVLTASASSQALYLDGNQTGAENGAVTNVDPYDFVGAGVFNGNGWPAAPGGNVWSHFNGQISDAAVYQRPLDAIQVKQQYQADSSGVLSKVTLPSGVVQSQVNYDAAANRVSKVTDINGGTWTLQNPTAAGSSTLYKAAVLGSNPADYWRLNDAAGSSAADLISGGSPSQYSNVTLGVTGPFGIDDSTAAGFNGATSYVGLGGWLLGSTIRQQAVELWFSTQSSGMLLGFSSDPVTQPSTTNYYAPGLYVGTDGLLYGELWNGSIAPMHTSTPVNDGKWHQVVLTTDGLNQQLYLDGNVAGNPINGYLVSSASMNVFIGAGMIGSSFPAQPHYSTTDATGYPSFFNGQIAEVSIYQQQLTGADVTRHFKAYGSSVTGPSPMVSDEVEDPTGNPLNYTYDPYNGGRLVTATDASDGVTTYGYDSGGFLNTVTDPDGDVTITGHDVRGNVVSRSPCNCGETSYYTYFPDDTSTTLTADPRNDVMTTFRDGRSADAADTSYLTRYGYDAAGQITSTATPPVDGYPNGRTTTTAYTDGSAAFPAADTGNAPAGLVASTTTPGGATTKYSHFRNGDVASITDAAGLVTRYSYDNLGRVQTKTQVSDTYPAGLTTNYSYDWGNRVLNETDPGVTDQVTGKVHTKSTTTGYNVDGLPQTVAVADTTAGDTTRTTNTFYDGADRVQKVTDAAGASTNYGYDLYGNRSQVINANNVETDYAYSPTGHLLTTTLHNYTGDPVSPSTAKDLVTESRAYDPAGRLGSITDAMGRTKAYAYWNDGRLQRVNQVDSTGKITNQLEYRTYDLAGNVTQDNTADNNRMSSAIFDAANRPYQSWIGNDNTTTAYDGDDHPISVSKSQSGSSTVETTDYTYDPLGRLTSQTIHDSTAGQASAASLTGQWNLVDGATTTAADGATANHPGTLSGGVTWSLSYPPSQSTSCASTCPGSAVFDGTTGKITSSGPVVDTSGSFSVSAWVMLTDTNAYYPVVTQTGTGGGYGFWLGYDHNLQSWALNTINADTGTPTTWYSAAGAPGSAKTGVWTHLAAVVTRPAGSSTSSLQLYVNGQLQTTRQDTWASPFNATKAVQIGQAGGSSFKGSISQVAVYHRPLSFTEIVGLYQNITGTAPGQNGLVGSWALNDGSAQYANDTSAGYVPGGVLGGVVGPNGPNPGNIFGGVSWSADHNGSALFDGSSGAITTSNNAVKTGPGQSFTVSAWANLTSTNGSADVITQDSAQNSGFNLQYDKADNAWAFSRCASDTANATPIRAHATTAPTMGQWTHLVGVYDGSISTMSLYVNGQLAGTATDPTPYASSGDLAIGRGQVNAAATDWFPGEISAVQAYNTALSASEVSTLYSAGTLLKPSTVLKTTWQLDKRGLPVSMTDPRGNTSGAAQGSYTSNYTNDEAGRTVVTIAAPVNAETSGGTSTIVHPTTRIGYDTFGDATSSQDANGNIVVVGYDLDGRPTGTTRPAYTAPGTTAAITSSTQIFYDPVGQVQKTVDPLGYATTYQYDQLGDRATRTDPPIGGNTAGGVWHGVYYPDGRLQSGTDPTGAQTQYTYNLLGQRQTATQIVRLPNLASYTTNFGYDTAGDPTKVTTPLGVTTSATYDGFGNPLTTIDGANNTTTYTYDLDQRRTSITYPDKTEHTISYDLAGHAVAAADLDTNGAVLRTTSAGYDNAGNPLWSKDAQSYTTNFVFDAANRLSTQVEPVSPTSSITTTYGYDAAGNRTRYTNGNNNPWITTYNVWNLPESTIDPSTPAYPNLADRTYTTGFDTAAHPVSTTEPGGVSISRTFDALGNLTKQTGVGAEASTVDRNFGYDLAGHLVSASAPGGNDTFNWDDRGLLLNTAGPSGTANFSYNGDSQMQSRADAAGTTSYKYDTAGRLSTINDSITGSTLTYGYNTLDQVNNIGYGTSGDTRTLNYDNLHRLTSDTLKTSTSATIASITYGYNPDDQLNAKTTTGFAGSAANSYSYDQAGRLTKWNNGTSITNYSYDPAGNRIGIGNRTLNYNARDQLTNDGTSTYSYSARGTLTGKTTGTATETIASDSFDEVTGDGITTYAYDALGRLVQRNGSGGLSYSGLDNNLVADGTATYSRDPNGGLVSVGQAGAHTLAWSDRHGDVVGTFTAVGAALTDSATYDPLGNVLSTNGAQHNLGYQGGWTDSTTKKTNMAARWYDPQNGMFMSRDSAANSPSPRSASANTYGYGSADPMDAIDPTGHYGETIDLDLLVTKIPLFKIYAPTEAELAAGVSTVEDVLGSMALADVAGLLCGPLVEACEGASVIATWKRLNDALLAAGLSDIKLGSLGSTDPYAPKYKEHKPQPWPKKDPKSDSDIPSGPGDLPSPRSGEDIPSGPGDIPPRGPWKPEVPKPPKPVDFARKPAAHPGVPPLGDGSGIDWSPRIVVDVVTAVVELASEVGSYDPNTQTAPAGQLARAGMATGGTGDGGNGGGPRRPCDGTSRTVNGPGGSLYTYDGLVRQAGVCVASGASADLTPESYTPPPRPGLGFNLPGMGTLPEPYARGHLIGYAMGGVNGVRGFGTRNFVPMYQAANQTMADVIENPISAALKNGGSESVTVVPIYGDPLSPVPTAIDYTATGAVNKKCIIFNTISGENYDCT